MTETDVRALAAAVARIELQLGDLAEALDELADRLPPRLPAAEAPPSPQAALATAAAREIAAHYGACFTSGELLAWCAAAPAMPGRRDVRAALAALAGGECDAQRLGLLLRRWPAQFERIGERAGAAVWQVRGSWGEQVP